MILVFLFQMLFFRINRITQSLSGKTYLFSPNITSVWLCIFLVLNSSWACDNCSAICDKSINQDGRWFYDCQNLTGEFLDSDNGISIKWDNFNGGAWRVLGGKVMGSTFYPIRYDSQWSTWNSVCIDPDISPPISNGSLECLDGPDWVLRCDNTVPDALTLRFLRNFQKLPAKNTTKLGN